MRSSLAGGVHGPTGQTPDRARRPRLPAKLQTSPRDTPPTPWPTKTVTPPSIPTPSPAQLRAHRLPLCLVSNTIRILIATDSHVGYNERDPIRGDDSWQSFHEVMQVAKDRDVDMVLLSGDLFHENKPSRKAMYQVIKTLRETCLGEKPCELDILSDTSTEFQSAGGHVNYQDPDINVAIPVFSIHGNHDDPSGVRLFRGHHRDTVGLGGAMLMW